MRNLDEMKFDVEIWRIDHTRGRGERQRFPLGRGRMTLKGIYKEMDELGLKELNLGSWLDGEFVEYTGRVRDQVLAVTIYLEQLNEKNLEQVLDIGSRLKKRKLER